MMLNHNGFSPSCPYVTSFVKTPHADILHSSILPYNFQSKFISSEGSRLVVPVFFSIHIGMLMHHHVIQLSC